jgi:site-specific DNA-methyltransferase (adenine-specific)
MTTSLTDSSPSRNAILHGDCIEVMRRMPSETVDFILTDPPYLVRYRSRDGRKVANDDNARWLKPSFAEMYRLLKPGSFAMSFYGWNKADLFFEAWKSAGFSVVGHVVFRKHYASSARFLQYRHESAYLLAKGDVTPPSKPMPDVLDWKYTGNRLHPTQKPVECLAPIIAAFCKPGDLILDPFCGSGSTLVAARDAGCDFLGIELDAEHHRTASERLNLTSAQAVPHVPTRQATKMPAMRWPLPFTQYVSLDAQA